MKKIAPQNKETKSLWPCKQAALLLKLEWEKSKRYPSYYACMIDSDFCNAYTNWAFKMPHLKTRTYIFQHVKGHFQVKVYTV